MTHKLEFFPAFPVHYNAIFLLQFLQKTLYIALGFFVLALAYS